MPVWIIFVVPVGYIGLLFAIATWGHRSGRQGRSLIANPWVYSLSIAVYCTAWTFYGSVGRAASSGFGFLPIYLGPTLGAFLWVFVLRRMIRISKVHRITSIADFVASRYGKSPLLGALVSVIAIFGVLPYISLQLRAISTSFNLLWGHLDAGGSRHGLLEETGLYVAALLALFAILFGTRHLDLTEHHEGLVLAVAFESVVKLLAFLAVGLYVTWGLHDGLGDLFAKAAARPELESLLALGQDAFGPGEWISLMALSMVAVLLLPRQFQMMVVENVDENHIHKAAWLFPLYLLVINLFVLPIALAGRLRFPDGEVSADTFVLSLPLAANHDVVALLAFIGGLSAATAMVIVATVALSTMVSNDLLLPALLRLRALPLTSRSRQPDLSGWLLNIRRVAIVAILALSYGYLVLTRDSLPLVSTGLISFAAVAQFAPALLGGLYWRGGTRRGALAGLLAGFLVWGYTLSVPALAASGWASDSFVSQGPWGLELLRPYQLFGLAGLDPITHSLFWSLLINVGLYVGLSLIGRRSDLEVSQAIQFTEVFKYSSRSSVPAIWRGTVSMEALRMLLQRFLGVDRANQALNAYARHRGLGHLETLEADAEVVEHAETLLRGAIGAASARAAVASVTREEPVSLDQLLGVLDEATEVIAHSRELEMRTRELQLKSRELEATTAELQAANRQLQELDRLKDEFLSTMTHELRTPLTSIRAFTEILHDNPDLARERRDEFLGIILKENKRLTRLIGQVLDLAKIEAGAMEWSPSRVDLAAVVREAVAAMSQVCEEKGVAMDVEVPESVPPVRVDQDRMMQVMLNLLSNATKFCRQQSGWIRVRLTEEDEHLRVSVEDDGHGIPISLREKVFERFRQLPGRDGRPPQGSGLGLPISRQIVSHFGGRMWIEDGTRGGARLCFQLPILETEENDPRRGVRQ